MHKGKKLVTYSVKNYTSAFWKWYTFVISVPKYMFQQSADYRQNYNYYCVPIQTLLHTAMEILGVRVLVRNTHPLITPPFTGLETVSMILPVQNTRYCSKFSRSSGYTFQLDACRYQCHSLGSTQFLEKYSYV